jgi:hypothetical protein
MNLSFIKDLKSGKYKISLGICRSGSHKIRFSFRMREGFLDKYYLYMQHTNRRTKYSFPNMIFKKEPPGVKFGPWPGWRFVPEMPELNLSISDVIIRPKFYFTGDETQTGKINAYSDLEIGQNKMDILLTIDSNDIELDEVELFSSNNIKISNKKVVINENLLTEHPRLLFSSSDLPEYRMRLNSKSWIEIVSLFDNWLLIWKTTPEVRTIDGKERLNILDKIILAAFHALITEENKSINRAKKIFRDFIKISSFAGYEPMKIDTQIGICLFYMCLAYDWMYIYLAENEKIEFKRHLDFYRDKLLKYLNPGRTDFAQAHFLGCVSGLLAYSFLFYDEYKESRKNTEFIANAFFTAMKMFPDDGSYPHGINLWIYEYTFLVRITELLYRFTNINLWDRKEFWKNSSLFRNYSTSPDKLYGITFGDPQYRVCGDAWIHYLISERINDNNAKKYASEIKAIDTSGVDHRNVMPSRRIFEFIYSNEKTSRSKSVINEAKYFKDTGQIFIKSKDFLFTTKCGAPLGIQRHKAGEWSGYGHSDTSNGSFLIYSKNTFLITGPESSYKRNTEFYNTITVDGSGQIGDKMVWSPDFNLKRNFPKITKFERQEFFNIISMDLTPCYNNSLDIKKIERNFVVFNSGIVIGYDKIKIKKNDRIEWNLHSYGIFHKLYDDNIFRIQDKDQYADLYFLNDYELYEKGFTPFVPGYPNSGKRDRFVKIIKNGYEADFIYLLNIYPTKNKLKYEFDKNSSSGWSLDLKYNKRQFQIICDGNINVK